MGFSTWSDFYTSEDRFEDNVAALEIIHLLDEADPKDCTRNLQEQGNLAALIVDGISGDLI